MPRRFYPLPQAVLDSIARKQLGVAYCTDSPMQILDLYYPDQPSEGPYPLIIHTHGGAFANGDQRENNLEPMLRGLKRGFAVASIQYRRSREALFPAQVYDAKAAVRFLRASAEEYGLEPDRFAAWGAVLRRLAGVDARRDGGQPGL